MRISLSLSSYSWPDGSAESAVSFATRCEALSALGIQHAVVISNAPWSEERIAILGAVTQ